MESQLWLCAHPSLDGLTLTLDHKDMQIRCTHCGAVNRIAPDGLRTGKQPVCGRCKSELHVSAEPLVITDATFAEQVERSPMPVLVDMWAPWCGPCRYLSPVVEELARELAGRIQVAKLNVDENPATAARFQIRGIPALLVFKGGREVDRLVGVQPKSEILRRIENLAA